MNDAQMTIATITVTLGVLLIIFWEDLSKVEPPPPPPPLAPVTPTTTSNAIELTRMTSDQSPEFCPRVSPNGKQILFHAFDESKVTSSGTRFNEGWSIILIDIGSPGRKLAAGPYSHAPAWYPDGQNFVYESIKMPKPVLVRTPIGNVGMTFISPQPLGATDNMPDVSPDGKLIAFQTTMGNSIQLCTVDNSGGNFTVYVEGFYPRWHPTEKKIVFVRKVSALKHDCFLLDLTSGQVTQLTSDESDNRHPVWSPNGKWIAFVSNRDGKEHLYVMRPDGSEVAQLTSGDTRETFPDWSSDNYIYFSTDAGCPPFNRHFNANIYSPIQSVRWFYADIWRLKPVVSGGIETTQPILDKKKDSKALQ